ncbi:MAG: hypothetical protein ACFHX7_24250 [Pseudomonadota bacterium]
MTLKQRRRQRELVAEIDQLKRSPYADLPPGYKTGLNPEEDAKYSETIGALMSLLEQLHDLEMEARDRT